MLFVVVAAASIASLGVAAAGGHDEIVGARIVTCSGCRLNHLHEVRQFIQQDLPTYPAVEIRYVSGVDPIIIFLNKYNREVKKVLLAPYDKKSIHKLIQDHNIHRWTPKPTFEDPVFTETETCVAWRQTSGCDPDGEREPQHDEPCATVVGPGRSGYCQCKGDFPKVKRTCDHSVGVRCDEACGSPPKMDEL
jgi:hypothetical protein